MATSAEDDVTTPEDATDEETEPLLAVKNLQTAFFTDKEVIRAVDGISFDIRRGETVGIVGESGSGKSVTARSIMGLIKSPGRVLDGSSIRYQGVEMTDLSEKEYHSYRGGEIAMVFQDPLTSLNPVYTVGNQIKESLRLHQGLRGVEATEEAIELLEAVGIPDAPRRVKEFPHQFSGGMRQRAVIAMALACDPDLLICDEPTTALDVTIQAQILELLQQLQRERNLAMMFITHDMGVIAEIADRVNVMYAGQIVERAPVRDLYRRPRHPYSEGLLVSMPQIAPRSATRLASIPGSPPMPWSQPPGCRFHPRCPYMTDACRESDPALVELDDDHASRCIRVDELDLRGGV